MPIYKPSELHQFLSSLGISPKKALSQNFLIDGNILRKIAEYAQVKPGDVVLEIGPGPGSLSEVLLEKGATLIAVEKDDTLAHALERLKSPTRKLEIFCEDILDFSFESNLSPFLQVGQKAKVIANLPYHLTTHILTQLVTMPHLFSSLYVMVQEEVARRFTAEPGNKDYGSISVFLNFYSTPSYAFTVSNQCFFPAPKIQSAVIALELKEPPAIANPEGFFLMTRTAFAHRRKMLRGSLRGLYSPEKITNALIELGLDPLSRPEQLSLELWLQFYQKMSQDASK